MSELSIPVDWKVLNAATDGDDGEMKELAAIYLEEGAKNVKKLRSAVRHEEPVQVAEIAHRFLGSSRFFGAKGIGVPLTALLKMSRSRHLGHEAAHLVNRTEKEFNRIDQYFKARRVTNCEKSSDQ